MAERVAGKRAGWTRMEIWAGACERRVLHRRNGDGLGGHSSLCGLASLREVLLVFIRGDSRDSRVGAGTAAECRGYTQRALTEAPETRRVRMKVLKWSIQHETLMTTPPA